MWLTNRYIKDWILDVSVVVVAVDLIHYFLGRVEDEKISMYKELRKDEIELKSDFAAHKNLLMALKSSVYKYHIKMNEFWSKKPNLCTHNYKLTE